MIPTEEQLETVAHMMKQAWELNLRTVKVTAGDKMPIWRFHARMAIATWEAVKDAKP